MTRDECDEFLVLVGKNIRQHRLVREIKLDELTIQAGIFDRATIGRIESGTQEMSLLTLASIAQALGVPPSDLLYTGVQVEIQIAGKTMYIPPSVADSLISIADKEKK